MFSCVMEVINPEDSEGSMPIDRLAGFTSDGASVMISPKEGVLGKLRRAVNRKVYSTCCPPHLSVLLPKKAKELPSDIEKSLSDTFFYFRDSAVRRDEFKKLQEMVEPGNPLITIVQYHKVRWLCLWLIVFPEWLIFCHCLLDTLKNKQKIHETKQLYVPSAEICNRLSMPISVICIYVYFLNPMLDLLSSVNQYLQSNNLTLPTIYCKIQALHKSFIYPVILDSTKSTLRALEDTVAKFPGSDFQKHLSDCSEHALLISRQISAAKKNA